MFLRGGSTDVAQTGRMRRPSSLPLAHTRPDRRLVHTGAILVGVITLGAVGAGCSSDANDSAPAANVSSGAGGSASGTHSGAESPGSSTSSSSAAPAATITIASNVAQGSPLGLSQPVTVSAKGADSSPAQVTDVTVTDAAGKSVEGNYDASAGTWTPAGLLTKNGSYTVTATAKTSDGQSATNSRTLLAAANGASTTGLYAVRPFKRSNVGNAQPVVLTFSQAVPQAQRAEVAKRFTVKDTANVEGAWRWVSPTRLDYRPKNKWPVGDSVTVTGSIQGMPIGQTWGAGTLGDVGFDVTSDLEAVYDPATHEVTVSEGGKVTRVMKSGGGKKGFESLTGKMVVTGKERTVRMTSCSVGISCTPGDANYYDEQINNAVQVSESGTYLHAAPWDDLIGKADTSHGCFHLSAADAKWFYDKVLPGNLFVSKGTNNPVSVTNGEGDWNLTWQQWIS